MHPLTARLVVRLLLACCGLLANACFGADADTAEAHPHLHVVRVNESIPEALAGVREYAQSAVETCRLTLHMSGSGPALSDAQLGKIVYYEDEAFYDGDRIAHYTTRRFVVADSGSSCAPYVLVQRDVRITEGCSSVITARSGSDIGNLRGGDATPGTPETHVENTGAQGDSCVRKRKPLDATGLHGESAGFGASCVWRSRLFAARFGAMTKSTPAAGDGPAPTGLDACLYQAVPHYESAHSAGEDVILRTHVSAPAIQVRSAQLAVSGGHVAFEGNTRLQSFESSAKAAAKFDKAAADAFVHLPPKEGV
jgi:hypothetical protein